MATPVRIRMGPTILSARPGVAVVPDLCWFHSTVVLVTHWTLVRTLQGQKLRYWTSGQQGYTLCHADELTAESRVALFVALERWSVHGTNHR